MNTISNYFFKTLIIIQGLFIFLWYTDFNFIGLLSWIGKGEEFDSIKLFSPLLIFGAIKILYWFADPLAKLFIIILNWIVIFSIFYFVYWLFFV